MNWNAPEVQLSLQELRETLDWRGRDSRLVRAAFAWSRNKKKFLRHLKSRLHGKSVAREENRLHVLFWLPGGLGDAACAKRLVTAYRSYLPDAVFEIYAPLPGVAQLLFGAGKNVHILDQEPRAPHAYDLAVMACMAAVFLAEDEARLGRLAPAFLPVLEQARLAQEMLDGLLDDLFLTDGLLGRWLAEHGGRRFDLLSYTGGVELVHDTAERLKVPGGGLEKFGLTDQPYLTFHDASLRQTEASHTRPTRCWPEVRWCEFLRLFKKEFPYIKIVQLGEGGNLAYEEADLCLLGKTDLADLPALLSGAQVHVDSESGLVHLAQFLEVRSVVVFGPSTASFLGYAKNENLSAGACRGCMWLTTDWMKTCPRGFTAAPCTECVSAQAVLDAVKRILPR